MILKPACAWRRCDGEAHRNAYIDNCGSCLGHGWERIAVCPVCCYPADDNRAGYPVTLVLAKSRKSGTCERCGKRYQLVEPNNADSVESRWTLPMVRYIGADRWGGSIVVDAPLVGLDGLIQRHEAGITHVLLPRDPMPIAISPEVTHINRAIADLIADARKDG